MTRERGSASIEAVGSIVSLALFAAVLLQILLVLDAYLVAGHATREGARALALGEGQTQVRYLVATVAGVHPNDAEISIQPTQHEAGELVTVTFTSEVVRLPVLATILPELRISADATARAEVDYAS